MLTYEDLPVGAEFALGAVTVSEAEIVEFARLYDPQPFHLDAEAARSGPFGGLVASGWHTCALVMRLVVEGFLLRMQSYGSPGVEHLRWSHPVRPGDRLAVRCSIIAARPSESKPDRGMLTVRIEAYNQEQRRVLSMDAHTIVRRG